jgi:catechol 2,3-dioxygenase-like lactoylglutathione lyase family enzyme
METSTVRAVLFVKDLVGATAFYAGALGMTRVSGDQDHAVMNCDGFELVVHQIPKQIADTIVIAQPPIRRVWGAMFFGYDPEGNQFGVSERK